MPSRSHPKKNRRLICVFFSQNWWAVKIIANPIVIDVVNHDFKPIYPSFSQISWQLDLRRWLSRGVFRTTGGRVSELPGAKAEGRGGPECPDGRMAMAFRGEITDMGMDQYLLIPLLGEWTSIYQLFWCSPGVQGFDTLPYNQWCAWWLKHVKHIYISFIFSHIFHEGLIF